MATKKVFIELVKLLEENKDKKVSTILEQVYELTNAKTSSNVEGRTFHKDEEGNTIAIYCYYFKKWMRLDEVEFGIKTNTASGYNTMCKIGVSNWTKQQRVAKQAKEQLLERLEKGELEVTNLKDEQAKIEAARGEINMEVIPTHYDTLEAALGN